MSRKQAPNYIPFTKEMKKTHTILIPNMLPMHFKMIMAVMKTYGYDCRLLETSGPSVVEAGLKYVHNDTCYPAILVIGQFIDAIRSGAYDPDRTALILFQTGGGCRASNYIPLLRKALERAGYSQVPVISLSLAGMEKHPGLELTLPLMHGLVYALLYGDLLMSLVNQCRTYEKEKGSAQALAARWVEKLGTELGSGSRIRYSDVKRNYREIIRSFAELPVERFPAVKVGIVGEIFVKYSPLGNNDLEQFLVNEKAEVVVPGLLDFMMYCTYNNVLEYRIRKDRWFSSVINSVATSYLSRKKNDIIRIMEEEGTFTPMTRFEDTIRCPEGTIGIGTKMGEGWLLTAEMLELGHSGVKNIVCTQPFGCLPNHICGKGMMKPIKEHNPDINIVAIDYDAGATRVNQENRLKLMLSNARENLEKELAAEN
ncbi:MAG: 2-hydroxyacyl-CoA dehydratase [Oscillospiraceae bacterium]|nr:2-hydroxyacyl-CoA dehydratase [Oscillospiraceae bacterium]